MRTLTLHASVVVVTLFILRDTRATTIFVPADFPTIQQAIDAATDGDTVLVAPGTYTGPENKNLTFGGKSITLRSEAGAMNTIIDCEADGRGFFLVNQDPATILVNGFTVTHGYVNVDSPGGRKGGGIYCDKSSVTFANCIIDDNQGHSGGGIYCQQSDPLIINCLVTNHQGFNDEEDQVHVGAGMLARQQSAPLVVNCTFTDNICAPGPSRSGGAIYTHLNAHTTVINCVFWGNIADQGKQLSVYDTSSVTVMHSTIEGGAAGVFQVDGGTLIWGDGAVDVDPLFTDPDNGDYSLSAGTACIDAGDNTVIPPFITGDLAGAARFQDDPATADIGIPDGINPIIDMGAFELEGVTSCPGDLSGDAVIGATDLLALLAAWGPCSQPCPPSCAADLDGDCDVDVPDLLALLSAWGPCP